jgi:hypothetical protein
MRRLVVLVFMALCAVPTWADRILDVTATGSYAPTQPCFHSCTAIGSAFRYVPPSVQFQHGRTVSGTKDANSRRTLGRGTVIRGEAYTRNHRDLLGCQQGQACSDAVGYRWRIVDLRGSPANDPSSGKPVAVPDRTSFLSLVLTSLGTVGLVWRWCRRDTQAA